MPKIYDITRTVAPTLAVWPGDTPFSFEQMLTLAEGDSVNLTTLTMIAHAGTHMDAPWHTEPRLMHPADMPLEPFIGPALVVSVDREQGGITPQDLGDVDLTGVTRVLLHTWYSTVPEDRFAQDFPYPTVALIDWLAAQGVVLLGVDLPTIDPFDSETLDGHHCLFGHGMVNLENLALDSVPDGCYELVALPLKLAGVCGSPVRAILRE
ncbi:cyclase family protein [Chloroflexota bacterium]